MTSSSFHKEIPRAENAFRFPIKALDYDIQEQLNNYKEQYHLVMNYDWVFVSYSLYGVLFIYVRDRNNVENRIDIIL